MTKTIAVKHISTSESVSDILNFKKAETENIRTIINTVSGSEKVRSVTTNRSTGEIKLRISSYEIPDNFPNISTK